MPNSNSAVVRLNLTRRRDLAQLCVISSHGTAPVRATSRSLSRSATVSSLSGGTSPVSPLESLENRTHLSVSKDAAGFTTVTPGAGDHVIYLSASGSDSNPGTQSAPIKTLNRGIKMLRSGTGDQLLLKRGETFSGSLGYWTRTGKSPDQPLVVGTYGAGSRPVVNTGSTYAMSIGKTSGIHDVVIQGIQFVSNGTGIADGIVVSGTTNRLLLEDIGVNKYINNIVLQKFFGPISNVTIRRSLITNSFSRGGRNSEGLFAEAVQGLDLEENVFDHNGWGNGKVATIFNHDAYVRATTTGLVARGNIFANASSHGLQARGGGIIENNLFLDNPLGMSFGLVHGSPVTPGGVSGHVTNNVFIGTRNIQNIVRGVGLEIGNIKPGGTLISGNVFANGAVGTDLPAISLSIGSGNDNFNSAVGINDLNLTNNVVYNWSVGIWVTNGMTSSPGPRALRNLNVTGNLLQNISSQKAIMRSSAGGTFSNNLYTTRIINKYYTNPGGTRAAVALADVSKLPGKLGGGSNAGFLALAEANTEGHWNTSYTATNATTYVKSGFVKK